MMRYVEGSRAPTSARTAPRGMEKSGVELLSTNQYAGNTKEGAQAVAENLLTAHPGVTGIFCSNESATHGMLRALEAAGLAGKVRFVGFDSSGTLLEGLRAGHIDALVLQDPVHMGDTAVRTLVDHLDGKTIEARVDTGVTVATGANLDSPEIAGLLEPDSSWTVGERQGGASADRRARASAPHARGREGVRAGAGPGRRGPRGARR